MEGKKFSFEKEKVIDTEAVEKSSDNVKKIWFRTLKKGK